MKNCCLNKTILLLSGIILIFASCSRKAELGVNESIICDMEVISEDSMFFLANNISDKRISRTDRLSTELARSGTNSILLKKGRQYGLDYRLKNCSPDEYYEVSIWRKSTENLGYLMVSDKDAKTFYKSTHFPDSVDANGWERLSISFVVPPSINRESVKILLSNPSDENVYFDDLTITRKEVKPYPSYSGIPALNLFIDTLSTLKLYKKRKEAFQKGILETSDDDWVEGILFFGEEMSKVDARLKGDWLDHLLGLKWSFRIKMEKSNTWNGMRTFSVQNPRSRDFINEWLLHQFCKEEDILATRYGFVPLYFNEKSLGIYSFEEHFEKNLVESNKRREGPILKMNENPFWKFIQQRDAKSKQYMLPVFYSSEILPFKEKRTKNNPALFGQFQIAHDLYFQYKFGLKPVSSIFDTDKLAKYMAMIDLFRTYHGFIWHNQRFYYNPVISKLEPIAFDNFSEDGAVRYVDKSIIGNYYLRVNEIKHSNFMLAYIFRDSLFVSAYINYLKKFSDENYLQGMLASYSNEIAWYDSLLHIEYQDYQYDPEYLLVNAKGIREELPAFEAKARNLNQLPPLSILDKDPEFGQYDNEEIPPHFVKAYTEEKNDSLKIVLIENYCSSDIILLGTAKKDKRIHYYIHPEIEVKAISGLNYGLERVACDTTSNFLFFMLKGKTKTYVVPIYPWKQPGGETPLQRMTDAYADNYKKYFTPGPGKQLILNSGRHEISESIIIPQGYQLVFPEASYINLTNEAAFISYSTIIMNGTLENPVIIRSSDSTANGFTVMQASERSVISHCTFDGLNTLDKQGWTLTGAVTFYESDVEFFNCSFQNNHCEDGLNIIRADFNIKECEFLNTFGDALDVDFGIGSIINAEFRDLSNDGIDVSGSQIRIADCKIIHSKDKAISGGEDSFLEIFNTHITNTLIGIASKDNSRVRIYNSSITNSEYGLAAFQKKPEFGPGSIEATNLVISNTVRPLLIEVGSSCIIDETSIEANEQNVFDMFY